MPDNEKSPQLKAAPPMPTVSVKDTMIIFLVRLKSMQLFTRLPIPAQAIVPKSNNMMPPSTALGMDLSNALILPITENKIAETNGKVRLQKNVIPTGIENEFYMYLSIDVNKEAILSEIFSGSGMLYTSSNAEADYGKAWDGGHYTQAETAWKNQEDDGSMRVFTIEKTAETTYTWTINITAGGQTYTITRYATKGSFSNGHIVFKAGDSWITVGDAAKTSGTILNITIDDEVLEKFLAAATNVTIGTVVDEMGQRIIATEIVAATGGTGFAEITNDGKKIVWNCDATTLGTEESGWYTNVAELLYKIKYNPSVSTGLENETNALPEKTTEGRENVQTNASAILEYSIRNTSGVVTNATANFASPVIRGMLYELKLKKVDSTDETKTLAGATFGLYKDLDCTVPATNESGEAITVISNEDGIIDFQNLPWGTYYVKETMPPAGYEASETSAGMYYTLCYTTLPSALTGQGANKEALYDATNNPIENTPTSKSIILRKVSATDPLLSLAGAEFRLYQVDENGNKIEETEKDSLISDKNGVFSPADFTLATGTYHLIETKAPDGYHLLTEPVVITVNDNRVSAMCGASSLEVEPSPQDDDGITTYTILVTNSTGTALPETGGAGAEGYQLAGLLLIAAVWLWKQKRLRERGNAHSPKA